MKVIDLGFGAVALEPSEMSGTSAGVDETMLREHQISQEAIDILLRYRAGGQKHGQVNRRGTILLQKGSESTP